MLPGLRPPGNKREALLRQGLSSVMKQAFSKAFPSLKGLCTVKKVVVLVSILFLALVLPQKLTSIFISFSNNSSSILSVLPGIESDSRLSTQFIPSSPISSASLNWVQDLRLYGRSVYSQGNQDGIIEKIFRHIKPNNRTFVEFGFGYTSMRNIAQKLRGTNTYNLRQSGWNGMYFDAMIEHEPINLYKELLTPENIVSVFARRGVPIDVDYVSIDIDSIDLWLLQALLNSTYRPTLISVEHNANFPYDASVTVDKEWMPWNSDCVYGASIAALSNVAGKAEYDPVYVEGRLDVFFIRRDRLKESGGAGLNLENMKELFPMPQKTHRMTNDSKLYRFVDFDTFQRTGDMDLARKDAIKHVEKIKEQRQ